MTNETKLLIGSLSNDLYRTANLAFNKSNKAATRFFMESKKWAFQIKGTDVKSYIAKIVEDVKNRKDEDTSIESSETYLMYSILLQNYTLKSNKRSSSF